MQRAWSGRVRLGTHDDLPFLIEMLYEAAFWRSCGDGPPMEAALSEPHFHRILLHWGREGDTSVVAVSRDEVSVGAAWYRFWTRDHHSFGFVDEETPEIGIAVKKGERGRGIGTALLEKLMLLARQRDIRRMSLSVEPDNPARRLYERLGFKKVGTEGGAWTLLVEL